MLLRNEVELCLKVFIRGTKNSIELSAVSEPFYDL
jgi:hypothetical protein